MCMQQGVKAEYVGESGFSGYTRNLAHLSAIRMDKPGSSAMVAHLRQHHPDEVGKAETMKVEVLQTFSKPLDRHLAESVSDEQERGGAPSYDIQATGHTGASGCGPGGW